MLFRSLASQHQYHKKSPFWIHYLFMPFSSHHPSFILLTSVFMPIRTPNIASSLSSSYFSTFLLSISAISVFLCHFCSAGNGLQHPSLLCWHHFTSSKATVLQLKQEKLVEFCAILNSPIRLIIHFTVEEEYYSSNLLCRTKTP